MKIMLAYRAFDGIAGGVERMSTSLMNEMVKRGHDVTLLTWDKEEAASFYPMEKEIDWIKVNIGDYKRKATHQERLKRILKVRKEVKRVRPDVILCFMNGSYFGLRPSIIGLGVPVVLAERNAPTMFDFLKAGKYQEWIFQTYRFTDAITIQCESFRKRYPSYLHSKITTIPNPVFPAGDHENDFEDSIFEFKKTLLSVGRLSYQKNYMSLVKAFAEIADQVPDWGLVIIGDGDDRIELEKEIKKFGLQERINLLKARQDIWKAYRSADLFCLPSRWEGFPNALAEALIRGVPGVGYENSAGVCDLITHKKNGILAPENGGVADLAATLLPLMQDESKRQPLAKQASETMKIYDPSLIYNSWEGFLKKVAKKG